MCTVIIANHHHKEFPLVVAANRDEDIKKASSPVQILSREPHLIIGGKDDVKGGTWLGVNKESIFVAVTNQDGGVRDPKLESRGSIVMEALKRKTINEVLSFIEELNPAKYNKFNLIFGNQKEVYIAHSYILHSMVIREIPAGIHIISSDMKFNGESPKAHYVHQKLDPAIDTPWLSYYKTLKKVLANSESGVKVKQRKKDDKVTSYCTRSSSILSFTEEGLARYKFHDRTSYKPRKSESDPHHPRYKDYIDLWRNPDAVSSLSQSPSEDEGPDVDEVEEVAENTKEKVMSKFRKLKDGDTKKIKFIEKMIDTGLVSKTNSLKIILNEAIAHQKKESSIYDRNNEDEDYYDDGDNE